MFEGWFRSTSISRKFNSVVPKFVRSAYNIPDSGPIVDTDLYFCYNILLFAVQIN